MRSGTRKGKGLKILSKLILTGVLFSLVLSPFNLNLALNAAHAQTPTAGATDPTKNPTPTPNTDGNCTVFDGSNGIANCLAGLVYIFTVGLGSAIAYFGSSFLNFAVHASLDSTAYSLNFISNGWTTARDIANMAFIFILVYIALMVIFQAQTGHTMEQLTRVIAIALIINFSFFFTRVVIDAGNILSVQFYNSITSHSSSFNVVNAAGVKISVPDVTANIMDGLNLQQALNTNSFQQFAKANNNSVQGFFAYLIALSFVYIAVGIVFFLLAGVFIIAGVKFLVRIVVLWFLIIASPLALVAYVIPGQQKRFGQWRTMLISHAFYPVVFLFVLLILSRFMSELGSGGSGGIIGDVFADVNSSGTVTDLGSFLQYMGIILANLAIRLGFIIAMFIIGIRAADSVGVYTSDALATRIGGLGGGAVFGIPAWALRNTVGRGANAITETKGYQAAAQTKLGGFALRNLRLESVAKGSFDVRNPAGSVLGAAGLSDSLGKSRNKNGFRGELESDAKKIEERAEKYKLGEYAAHKEQRRFEKNYESDPHNDTGEKFDEKIERLTKAIKDNKDAVKTETKALRAMTKGTVAFKAKQDEIKAIKDEITDDTETRKGMLEHGLHHISEMNTKTMKAFARRVSTPDITNYFLPSPGAKMGAARVIKATEDHDHAGHGDHGHDDHGHSHGPSWITPPKGGGLFGSGGGGGGDHGGGGHH